ncbi:MAG: T9SS type A sorting domain-containing protein [Flavobacteriales bacterium]
MRNLLQLLFLLLTTSSHAQYTIDWSHPAADTYKNGVMAARDTSDNVIVVGTRTSFVGAAHIYTHKYDKDGILLWEQVDASGVAPYCEQPTWVATSGTNNIYVTGYMYTGTSNIIPDSVIVLKYDAQGDLQWRRMLGPTFIFGVQVRCAVDDDDNLYVGAAGLDPGGFHLIKYDANGTEIFHTVEADPIGINMTSMRLQGDRVVLSGRGIGAVHGAVVTWDTDGNFLWSRLIRGYTAQDVELDDDLNTYALTSYEDLSVPLSDRDVLIKIFNANGDSITQHIYDFNGTDEPTRMSLVNGRVTVIGWTVPTGGGYMNWTTFQTDMSGALLWNATYDQQLSTDEIPGWLAVRNNGDVYVTGKGGPLYQGQYQQFVTLKYSNGVQQWAHTDPYFGYNGVACVLGKDSALYVLGQGAMTVTRYLDEFSTGLTGTLTTVDPSAYPVPAGERLIIHLPALRSASLAFAIHDPTGRAVSKGSLWAGDNPIDVQGLSNGTYLLRTADGRSTRFIVAH